MESKKDQYTILVQAILPSDLFDYFEIVEVTVNDETIDVHLDERNVVPSEYQSEVLISKGFHSSVVVQDFPIRERAVFLHVRRRKWLVASTGKIVSMNWEIAAKGARYTKSFASFLKGLLGQLPD